MTTTAFRQPRPGGAFIPYKNPMGLTAYYLGVFSFIPCLGLASGAGRLDPRHRSASAIATDIRPPAAWATPFPGSSWGA